MWRLRAPAGTLIMALLAPGAWFVALAILYALATGICAGIVLSNRTSHLFAAATILIVTVVVIIATALPGFRRWSEDGSLGRIALLLALVSLLATLWLAVPVAMLSACST